MTNLNANPALSYTRELLTAKEQAIIEGAWDGEALLTQTLPSPIKVAVHNGEFHADELVGVALIEVLLGTEVEVVRTRDPKTLDEADLRVDVGEGLLDHHGQRAEPGVAACSRVLALLRNSTTYPSEVWEALAPWVDDTAAVDTGDLSRGNPNRWVHAACVAARARGTDLDEAFLKALARMKEEVADVVEAALAAHAAKEAAEKAIKDAGNGSVVVFPASARLANVKELLYETAPNAVYYISPEAEADWRILCAADPEKEFSFFSSRRLIPERFRGLRGEGLSKAAGVPGAIFCHAAGFIAGFTSQEAAEQFAKLCLED